ncbi:hypothetical protein SAMN06297251_10373 [Fulvimarina manganoxydans]|uniref:Ribonuclease VapC n=1 Tax=Fulvimarina manganoxydans TaxID=937218 RepID=A0A1W1ZSR1_9HYPH|nr:PIN domain-containing protein [Fulvimarina manganoxydans]MEE2952164.1 PIN domain-containing protein [Pseudomonadota bacterium]SMC51108.1 hypothetical protein SAMN06297251_10373 [Fulvimarina manganoxydans]
MILIDTSAWIDHLNGRATPQMALVRQVLADEDIVIGDVVLVELLQGVREDREAERIRALVRQHRMEVLGGPRIAELAAANYRTLRRRGLTIRGTIDVVIATWCIVDRVPIIHHDKDMGVRERDLGLLVYRPEA